MIQTIGNFFGKQQSINEKDEKYINQEDPP